MSSSLVPVAAIVFLAFVVQASIGFGSALVAVTFGSMIVGVEGLLPVFMPVNLALSAWIVLRWRRHVAWGLLARRVLPGMFAGLPLGLFAFGSLPAPVLRRVLGVFVVVLSALELWRLRRPEQAASSRPLPRAAAFALLVLGGAAQGAFATGGPIAVYVAGRDIGEDKASFRATMSALWLVLNVVMVIAYAFLGKFSTSTIRETGLLVPALALGIVVGEMIHARLPVLTFKKLVFAFVGVAGMFLLVDVASLRR